MNSVWILIVSFFIFVLAYKTYGHFIADKLFRAKANNPVPSVDLRDDIDYMPTKKEVLFGHHFASIAGTGPIVGPAIAVIWGWVPALVWVIIGSVFAGAVHDFASLIISVRNDGRSIGDITKDLINPRVRKIFLFVIFFSLWIVVSIFGMVIAVIFKMYPQSVFPIWCQIPIAVAVGWLSYRKNMDITALSVIAVILMYLSIFLGMKIPLVMPVVLGMDPMSVWVMLLLIYAFVASVLPVWTLLQPRDYINSHQLIIGLVLLVGGVIVSHPVVVAPVFQLSPEGAPPIVPFLFITVACGAVSGFHSLVSSGTSSKQLKNESEAKFIGFGGMLMEGFLAVLVIIAVTAGIGIKTVNSSGIGLAGIAAWNYHYSSWAAMSGLTAKVSAFVSGSANMLESLGIPFKYGCAVIGVLVASFAGTTLDTATRIQRYVLSELASEGNILKKRYPATFIVVLAAFLLAFSQGGGRGALILWPLFGTSNQLLAGLALLVAAVYALKKGYKTFPILIPMFFIIATSAASMIYNAAHFYSTGKFCLFFLGIAIMFFEAWMIAEVVRLFKAVKKYK